LLRRELVASEVAAVAERKQRQQQGNNGSWAAPVAVASGWSQLNILGKLTRVGGTVGIPVERPFPPKVPAWDTEVLKPEGLGLNSKAYTLCCHFSCQWLGSLPLPANTQGFSSKW
jgi:hypothetical protein